MIELIPQRLKPLLLLLKSLFLFVKPKFLPPVSGVLLTDEFPQLDARPDKLIVLRDTTGIASKIAVIRADRGPARTVRRPSPLGVA